MFFCKKQTRRQIRLKKEHITVSGLQVEVWWKAVKRVNLVVYADGGRVRISVPFSTSMSRVKETIEARMAWIKTQQDTFRARKPAMQLNYSQGEMHLFWGKQYPLHIAEGGRRHFVRFDPLIGITLHLQKKSSAQQRQNLLLKWYREQLILSIPPLLEQWQPKVEKEIVEFRIKRMKTRWGTCNISKQRIWLNLELIKKPKRCLEYILVHEMVHLLEPGHTTKFYAHLDTFMPGWRDIDLLLKQE